MLITISRVVIDGVSTLDLGTGDEAGHGIPSSPLSPAASGFSFLPALPPS